MLWMRFSAQLRCPISAAPLSNLRYGRWGPDIVQCAAPGASRCFGNRAQDSETGRKVAIHMLTRHVVSFADTGDDATRRM
eukprot:894635-Rhodomonas_salina.1